MKFEEWSIKELESLYVNIIILEECVLLKKDWKIKKQKVYIFIGLNLKGYKEIIDVFIPEEETTAFWFKSLTTFKDRGMNDVFIVAMINNKWIKKTFKMLYPEAIIAPSMIEIYNKSQNYIARKDHRIVMQELARIYKEKDLDNAKTRYNNLIELYKSNKLLLLVINKYINEIFGMFKYSHEARIVTANTDIYNKIRNRVRWKLKIINYFEDEIELKNHLYDILSLEESKWHPVFKRWDVIIDQMDCDLADKIMELI